MFIDTERSYSNSMGCQKASAVINIVDCQKRKHMFAIRLTQTDAVTTENRLYRYYKFERLRTAHAQAKW